MKIITTTESLDKFCATAQKSPFLVVDTEFMRESTFYSQLCLIQVAIPNDEAIIDPMADGIDLASFLALLLDEKITKVMHAARQDMEIFYKLCDAVPKPVFDTQLAAMALGFGDSVGYMALVKGRLGKNLDKGARFTDWSRRPLTDKQLHYAIGDVTHLRDLYPDMVKELEDKKRLSWVNEEMADLLDPHLYQFEPERAWMRLRPRKLKQEYLAAMKAAAAWREREAQNKDTPRNRILKDDGIYDIAMRQPKTVKELGNLRGVPNGFERRKNIDRLLKSLQDAHKNAATYAPVIQAKKHMPPNLGPTIDILKTLLRLKTEYEGIAPRLIANAADIEQIAAFGSKAQVKALEGWRREVFGSDALLMLDGKLSLTLNGREVVAIKHDG
ncbi:MAG: ribonuclease D [Hyphomonadaceae bacterium]|nr:ribonuclease D [Hyphomonadaceae bacterium]